MRMKSDLDGIIGVAVSAVLGLAIWGLIALTCSAASALTLHPPTMSAPAVQATAKGVVVNWQPPLVNEDGTQITFPVTYSVYRAADINGTKLQKTRSGLKATTVTLVKAPKLPCVGISATANSAEGAVSDLACTG